MLRVTDEERARAIKMYTVGKMALQNVADEMYLDRGTVRKIMLEAGITIRHNNRACKPIAMIMHDWNAGVSTTTIMAQYGFDNQRQFHTWLSNRRKEKYNFKRRYANRQARRVE